MDSPLEELEQLWQHVSGISSSEEKLRLESTRILEELFFTIVAQQIPEIFLEIGAHEASASCRVAQTVAVRNVYAFEANPFTHLSMIEENPALNCEPVVYVNMGIGEHVGFSSVKIPNGSGIMPGHTSMLYRNDGSNYKEFRVPCTTVDTFLAGRANSNDTIAMWIDVEGLAYEVLSSAKNALCMTKVIYVEVEDRQYWRDQRLAGHVVELLAESGFIPFARDKGAGQFNLVLLKDNIRRYYRSLRDAYHSQCRELCRRSM